MDLEQQDISCILIIDPEDNFQDEFSRSLAGSRNSGFFKDGFNKIADKIFDRNSASRDGFVYELVFCSDLEEAMKEVAGSGNFRNKYAMLILELEKVAYESGLEELAAIRHLDSLVNVLILTSGSDMDIAHVADKVQPFDKLFFVEKPLTSREIEHLAMVLTIKWQAEVQVLNRNVDSSSGYGKLEELLTLRTKNLRLANEKIDALQDELRDKEMLNAHLLNEVEESSVAIKILLKNMAIDDPGLDKKVLDMKIRKMDETLILNLKQLSEPFLDKLERTGLNNEQSEYLGILRSNLDKITSPVLHRLQSFDFGLTSSELQVANLVRQGKTSKSIAAVLNLSIRTIEFHRDKIRKKLGVKSRKTSLRAALDSFDYPDD